MNKNVLINILGGYYWFVLTGKHNYDLHAKSLYISIT